MAIWLVAPRSHVVRDPPEIRTRASLLPAAGQSIRGGLEERVPGPNLNTSLLPGRHLGAFTPALKHFQASPSPGPADIDRSSRHGACPGTATSHPVAGPSNVKAICAKQYIEAHGALVTSAQVYAAIDPASSRAWPRRRTLLLREWIERWLELKVDVAATTHAEYARILCGRVAAELGDLPVAEISRYKHVDPWKAALSRELMPAGVRKHWTVLNQVMRDAAPHRRSDNPMRRPVGRRGNGLPHVTPHEACVLDPDQVGVLLAHCPEAIHGLVTVLLATGLRLGELLGLRAGDVYLGPAALLRVERTLRRDGTFAEPKTARSRRTVALTASTAALFARLIAGKLADELVFPVPGGGPWKAGTLRQRYWQPAVVAAQRCPQHPPVGVTGG